MSDVAKVRVCVDPFSFADRPCALVFVSGQAEELLLQAQKKLKGGWFFGGGSTRYEEASELYIKAANIFKMAKRCTSSIALIGAAMAEGGHMDSHFVGVRQGRRPAMRLFRARIA